MAFTPEASALTLLLRFHYITGRLKDLGFSVMGTLLSSRHGMNEKNKT